MAWVNSTLNYWNPDKVWTWMNSPEAVLVWKDLLQCRHFPFSHSKFRWILLIFERNIASFFSKFFCEKIWWWKWRRMRIDQLYTIHICTLFYSGICKEIVNISYILLRILYRYFLTPTFEFTLLTAPILGYWIIMRLMIKLIWSIFMSIMQISI